MPQKIHEFKSTEEAVHILEKFGKTFEFPIKSLSQEIIINKSVSSNIFRAFQYLNIPPSKIYRNWATASFDTILSEFKTIKSNKDYYQFIFKYGDSLINRWAQETKAPNNFLIYGPAMKMINLLIKDIQESKTYRQIGKIKYQQIPFDSFSLRPLRLIVNDLTVVKYKISIPPTVSMGFINTQQLYIILMDAVYKLCKLSKISPIVYDYWCWNDKH